VIDIGHGHVRRAYGEVVSFLTSGRREEVVEPEATLDAMPISRRTLIGLSIPAVGGALLTGCSSAGLPGGGLGGAQPSCAPRGNLVTREHIGAARLVYDITAEATSFRFESGFHDQLQRWLADYLELTPTPAPDRIRTFGAWTDGTGDCDSWHNAGRAFDLARVVAGDEILVSCRYDLWREFTGAQLDRVRTRYWALAASLHLHFAYVLTYLYDGTHHNHIHVDNGRSGSELSEFSTRSPSQVQGVQGMLTHVWGETVEITGSWDRATSSATRSVLDRVGAGGRIDWSQRAWHAFLRATASTGSE
jgi:hypothetical protein